MNGFYDFEPWNDHIHRRNSRNEHHLNGYHLHQRHLNEITHQKQRIENMIEDTGQCQNGWTFNSWDMKKRIDYFYVNQELMPRIKDIEIVGKEINKTIPGIDPQGGVEDMFDTLYP